MKRKKKKKLEEVKTLDDLSTNHIPRYDYENRDDRRSLQHSRDSSPVLRDRGSSLRSTPSINSLTSVGDEMMSNVPMFNAPLDFQSTSDTITTIPMDPQLAIESTSMVLAVTARELNQENQTVSLEGWLYHLSDKHIRMLIKNK